MSSNCDTCGQALEIGNLGKLVGMQISVTDTSGKQSEQREALVKAMSPYHPYKEYNVCFPCLLRALNVKP